jgi:hypothetical protein
MRRSRLPVLAAVIVLCTCGGPTSCTSTSPTSTSSPSTSPQKSSATETTTAGCQFTADKVTPTRHPLIEVQPPTNAAAYPVTVTTPLACDTKLSVADSGVADLKFGPKASCQLVQIATGIANLTSRYPVNAFFSLAAGDIHCTVGQAHNPKVICGMGTLLLNGVPVPTQWAASCDPPDPIFQVAVFAGSVTVIDHAGVQTSLVAGQLLTFDFSIKQSHVTSAQFTLGDIAVFAAQAQAMGLPVAKAPQIITFTSPPPKNPALVGDTYTVTAEGGGSGNPVTFTIDPSSGKACRISGQTVTFTAAGTCTIDANQAGNRQYLAAPQNQQPITVVAPTPTPSTPVPG